MSYGPFAVSRNQNGQVVFIENACPDDELEAEFYDQRKDFSYAEITDLIKESSYRNKNPKCKLHKICGSCQWQHIDYQAQLEFKRKNLEDLLIKAGIDCSLLPVTYHLSPVTEKESLIPFPLGMEDPWNYRNKVCYPVKTVPSTGRLQAGYFKRNSNELINIKYCPIQYDIFDQIIERVKDLCSENSITDTILRHILLRSNFDKSQILLCLIVGKKELFPETHEAIKEIFKLLSQEFAQLKTCTINYNTFSTNVILGDKTEIVIGSGYIYENIDDLKLRLSTTSFFQVNTKQFSKIIDLIKKEVSNETKVLDAYCGAGTIGLSLAKAFQGLDLTGIEVVSSAIKDAKKNAEINNIEANFIDGKVEDHIDELKGFDVVIINPPRKGCTNKVLDALGKIAAKKIIYVSCNPTTLVRDIKRLENFGYKLKTFQGVDMFPHSFHVETIAVMHHLSSELR